MRSQPNGLSLFVSIAPPTPIIEQGGSSTVATTSPPVSSPIDMDNSPAPVAASKRGKRRRGGAGQGKFQPRPRGADGGPLRTPQHIGDAWQSEEFYEVEKVTSIAL